ncbi:MAG: ABC transporter ATP-binding protein [Planctomycetota bacterium]|nr:ABC transporter ATP-binding protein [Planctomycetota bacterium]
MIVRAESGVPLAVTGLSVAYRNEPVLWDIDWSVRSGTMTAVVGPNGAGKSTLLNAALGLVPRLAGDARFWGQPFSAVRDRVAHVPQRESVDWDFPVTARDVVRMGATRGAAWWLPDWLVRAGAGRRETERRVDDALARVGMTELGTRPIGELSGGQQQRVFLARAFAQDADLVILDEPFAGVDEATEAVLTAELRRLVEAGRTVVAVHHDLESVARHFDDVLALDRTVQAEGPAAELLPARRRGAGAAEAAAGV